MIFVSLLRGLGLSLAAVMVVGCLIGDGLLFLKGKVISEQQEPLGGCELAYFLKGEKLDFTVAKSRFTAEIVESEFEIYFVISPSRERYYFAIRCPGYETPFKSGLYVIDGATYGPQNPLDLGTIVMGREQG